MMSMRLLLSLLSISFFFLSCERHDANEVESRNYGGNGRGETRPRTIRPSIALDSLTVYLPSAEIDTVVPHLRFDTMMQTAVAGVARGKLHGPYVAFSMGRPWLFGNYNNGEQIGRWYLYSDATARLQSTVDHLSKRADRRISQSLGDTFFVPYRVHIIDYWENGKIESEGDAVYDEDWLIDYFKVGTWTYYDSTGRKRSKKTFRETIE